MPKSATNKKLVIVESPTKARTITRFLPKEYRVESSYGHIRDLPESKMGVDVAHDFAPEYVIPEKAKRHVAKLKRAARGATEIILGADEDREGESIAWHLVQALGLETRNVDRRPDTESDSADTDATRYALRAPRVSRIVFHEITPSAIKHALEHPRDLDLQLVDAQQARRVLDRLVGYELSPLLWKKIRYGLSAGRVQSVALRLIVEREREIEAFKPEEYWTVTAELETRNAQRFLANLHARDRKTLDKLAVKNEAAAKEILRDLAGAQWRVASIEAKTVRRSPVPPFTTSTLQQEASNRLGFSARLTMQVAQQLYEGVEVPGEGSVGLITYMRTDSVNLAAEAVAAIRETIASEFGTQYVPTAPRAYRTKSRGAQEAHEAIRPTDARRTPDRLRASLDARQFKLYDLVWRRAMASQMTDAVVEQTRVDVDANPSGSELRATSYVFRATGQVVKDPGFLLAAGRRDDTLLPKLAEGEDISLVKLEPEQHFTQPPPRYTDASLVKVLETNGIGRPSTYAPTISTLQERKYIEREGRQMIPTDIGRTVSDFLVEHFPNIVDIQFTAKMEEELDDIAEGKRQWVPAMRAFYEPFKSHLEQKKESVEKVVEQTDLKCPECGSPMVAKFGRFGRFAACSRYPECKGTAPLGKEAELASQHAGKPCPDCGTGELALKRGRFGPFLGCNRYPECKFIEKIEKKTGLTCPKCKQGEVVEKRGKRKAFYGCNRYPECDYVLWQKPTGELCPKCSQPLTYAAGKKIVCSNKECGLQQIGTDE